MCVRQKTKEKGCRMFVTEIDPDYKRFVLAVRNVRPPVLPLYEHTVSPEVIGKLTGENLPQAFAEGSLDDAFRMYCTFFRNSGYDVVPFEFCLTSVIPLPGALCGGKGVIQSRSDMDRCPWKSLPRIWFDKAAPHFEALLRNMPEGMMAVGGVGNGPFEISEFLVGLEYLPFLDADDKPAHDDLYARIGDVLERTWRLFLSEFGEGYCACRIGDDLGFRSSLLTMPRIVRENVIPQYKPVIDIVHSLGKPFILHSCGCIFEIMDDFIEIGIDAKHSNEDAIAPFEKWIEDFSGRIALLGGIDMDLLVRTKPEKLKEIVKSKSRMYYSAANGFAIGTGNSIPGYVPAENYAAMLEAFEEVRKDMISPGS